MKLIKNVLPKKVLVVLIVLSMSSCANNIETNKNISFYHWKSKALFNQSYKKAFSTTKSNKLYLHYFDVESLAKPSWNDGGIFPTYVLKYVSKDFRDLEIVPVVYITNSVFKEQIEVSELSDRIKKLINQISEAHFKKEIKQIQVDCDWTESTRAAYFELINELQKSFEIDVTIRLHQIKFKDKTGVPPVKSGTLMLYNVGDLKNQQQNSILEASIVKQYVNAKTDYPLPLNLGLPLFSQTVIKNNNNEIKIINNSERDVLKQDDHFKIMDDLNLMVVKDTLYKGFFLSKGFSLKFEEINETAIIESYKIIKNSKLNVDEIIFYHLDEKSLSNINLTQILKNL